ncbi:exonuclease domain-containing protein [Mesobacillus harenae]|uniref:exonuclease domain-containing protein n=1 Tax=Mesobacillus harenae TaxID=2213203 RepID=UPI001580B65C|nr:exonuclease domain-containing protein [Mesobacillus harenae]
MKNEHKIGLLVDVETTGLGPDSNEVIELALKLFSFHEKTGEILDILDKESMLREPVSQKALANYDQAYRIHGIPYDLVRGKSFDDKRVRSFFTSSEAVFAHNASFDRSFLFRMYPEVDLVDWYCTMRGIPWKRYGFLNGKLLTLLKDHDITSYQSHRAMDDITNLMELLKKKSPNGNLYLGEIIQKAPMKKCQPAAPKKKPKYTYFPTTGLDRGFD